MKSLFFWITFCVYVLALIQCFRILRDRQTPQATYSWILLTLGLPWIAIPLYYFFGTNRIRQYIIRKKRTLPKFLKYAEQYAKGITPPQDDELKDLITDSFYEYRKIFSSFGDFFSPLPNYVKLLINGDQTFQEIFSAIENARHYILVQYYILKSDRIGIELKNLLVQKAKQGVQVYLLYDDMGSFWISLDFIKDLKNAGVRISQFLPVANFKRASQINFRNHRKLVAVDGVIAFTGGLNVGDEYLGKKMFKEKNLFWRDTHLLISGPSVKIFEEVFLEDWFFANYKKINLPPPKLQKEFLQLEDFNPPDNTQKAIVQIVPTGPTDPHFYGIFNLLHGITMAKKRVWIATPYFVPDVTLERALELAALREIDVRILLPYSSDHAVVHWVSLSYAKELQKKGIKIYLYQKGFMHQKVLLIDDDICGIGTTNFDNRALYLNFETSVIIHSKEFAKQFEEMLENDFHESHILVAPYRESFFTQAVQDMARLLAPLL